LIPIFEEVRRREGGREDEMMDDGLRRERGDR